MTSKRTILGRALTTIAVGASLSLLLAACGQRGPLYLPAPPAPKAGPAAAPPAAVPVAAPTPILAPEAPKTAPTASTPAAPASAPRAP
jgi:predicted small lipoprotein YifL